MRGASLALAMVAFAVMAAVSEAATVDTGSVGITLSRATKLMYDKHTHSVFVGDRTHLRKLSAATLAEQTSVALRDPTPDVGNSLACRPYWVPTTAQSNFNFGAAYDFRSGRCSAFSTQGTCEAEDCTYNSRCREPYYLSSCSGNTYYIMMPLDDTTFISCSTIGQCQRLQLADLSDTNPPPDGYPLGYYCGLNKDFVELSDFAVTELPEATLQKCPVFRYGPPENHNTLVTAINFLDTAVATIAKDLSDPAEPDALYLIGLRELLRDNYPDFSSPTEPLDMSNWEHSITKRSLTDFSIRCPNSENGCAKGVKEGDQLSAMLPTNNQVTYEEIYASGKQHQYIGAFARDGFVYFVLQQYEKNSDTKSSKIARFCTDTYPNRASTGYLAFNGFVKLPFACGGGTLVSGVDHVPAGGVLTDALQTTSSTLLFAIGNPSNVGALCVFTFGAIQRSSGTLLSAALDVADEFSDASTANPCAQRTAATVVSTAALGLSYPLEQDPGTGRYTALKVDVVHGHSIAYVGTATGQLVRIHTKGLVQTVSDSAPIGVNDRTVLHTIAGSKPIVSIDVGPEDNAIFALTSTTAARVDLHDCESFTTCSSCMAATNPYCGWCVLESKCSERVECAAALEDGTELRSDVYTGPYWLQDIDAGSNDTCPGLLAVDPAEASVGHETALVLDVSSLPPVPAGLTYFCTLEGYTHKAGALSDNQVTCIFTQAELAVPSGTSDSPAVGLAVGVDAASAVSILVDVTPDTTSFVLFDCARVESDGCSACAALPFQCGWCIYDNTCKHTDAECRAAVDWTVDDGLCPTVTDVSPNKTHVVSGDNTPIQFDGINFPTPQGGDVYTCSFSPSTGLSSATAAATFASSSSVTCSTPPDDGSAISGSSGMVVRTASLLLNGIAIQGAELTIDFFDCVLKGGGETTGDCPLCLSPGVNVYGCGWCKNGNPSLYKCTLEQACPNAEEDWIPNSVSAIDQCPKPFLTEVTPVSAPLAGGTIVTIVGEHLARAISDIANVTVAGELCPLQSYDVVEGEIQCQLQVTAGASTGPAIMNLKSGISASSAAIPTNFARVQPRVTSFSPSLTPTSGGSIITIKGSGLESGNAADISLAGGTQCDVVSRNTGIITCRTQATPIVRRRRATDSESVCVKIDGMGSCAPRQGQAQNAFSIVPDPVITQLTSAVGPIAGGTDFIAVGTSMNAAQQPLANAIRAASSLDATATCQPIDSTQFRCKAPNATILALEVTSVGIVVDMVFTMDAVQQTLSASFRYFPNPVISSVSPAFGEPGSQLSIEGTGLKSGGIPKVFVGGVEAPFFRAPSDEFLTVLVPDGADAGLQKVKVVLGDFEYEHTSQFEVMSSGSSLPSAAVGAAGGVGGLLVLSLLAVLLLYRLRMKRRKEEEAKLAQQMRDLEAQVVDVCRQGFAELQAGTQLALRSAFAQPYSFSKFTRNFLFTHQETHPVPLDPIEAGLSEDLTLFEHMLRDESFVVQFVQTLEAQGKAFPMRDRCHVAALLMASLPEDGSYMLKVLKKLLSVQIKAAVQKNAPKLLLRRTETVAEKLLSAWLAFGMYEHLTSDVGKHLLNLVQAFRLQIDKGPVDHVTGACKYTVNADYLLREKVNTQRLTLTVSLPDGGPDVEIEVNSCDCISQIKIKALDSSGDVGYSRLPTVEEVVLVEAGYPSSGRRLSDIDDDSEYDGVHVKLNTAEFYGLANGSRLRLLRTHEAMPAMEAEEPQQRRMSRKTSKAKLAIPMDAERWHLVATAAYEQGRSKIPSEVYLSYLMTVKGIVQPFVDSLFEHVFSTQHCPPVIKVLFDMLEELGRKHGVTDPEVIHVWKNNALPLRFWINIIKNPEFVFDIHKSEPINACLSTVAQVAMDSCSVSQQELGQHSPANKHLYRAEVTRYKELVSTFYTTVSTKHPKVSGSALDEAFQSPTHVDQLCPPSYAQRALLAYGIRHQAVIYDTLNSAGHKDMASDFSRVTSNVKQAANRADKSATIASFDALGVDEPTEGGGRDGYIMVDTLERRHSTRIPPDLFASSEDVPSTGGGRVRESALIDEEMFAIATEQTEVSDDGGDEENFGFDKPVQQQQPEEPADAELFGFGDLA